jgi:uncharacterized protein YcaQ
MDAEPVPAFPLRAVAALFLERQHLEKPRGRRFSRSNVLRFATDSGGIQVDTINVLDRAHFLAVWSRFGAYDRRRLEQLVYEDRVLFEYWAHAACLVPTVHFAYWRRAMLDYSVRSRAWGNWLQNHESLIADIENRMKNEGPLGSADFQQKKAGAGGWWNWKPSTHALDYLWMSGRTLVATRKNFHKRFDLAERVMPEALALEPASAAEFQRWHVRQSLHALGAATMSDLRRYLSFPRAGALDRRDVVDALIASGEVARVAVVDGRRIAGPWFALSRDLPALEAAASRRAPSRGTTMLTPFDSFLWHRERTERLFGFDYKIEVYTPDHQRVHGYYVLPVVHDGQLIGRVDAKAHRKEGVLEVKHVHFEPWFARAREPPTVEWEPLDRDRAFAGVAEALASLATFVAAAQITLGRVSPSRLGPPLRRALARR